MQAVAMQIFDSCTYLIDSDSGQRLDLSTQSIHMLKNISTKISLAHPDTYQEEAWRYPTTLISRSLGFTSKLCRNPTSLRAPSVSRYAE